MKILDHLYEKELRLNRFYPRKVTITHPKTILHGPSNSGKTTVLLDYLSNKKKDEYLYIDFNDLRIEQAIFIGLPSFIKNKNIKSLVLDNFDFSFTIPECSEVIISTNKDIKIDGFKIVDIYPLDFEEFIAFEKRQFDIKSIFNTYATVGTYPLISKSSKDSFVNEFQKLIISQMSSKLELEIFKAFALSQGERVSPFAIFNELKIFHKISKDKFYEILNKFVNEQLIFFLQRYKKPKADKKIYLIDFAIKSILTYEKDFIKRFENIIFLELYKQKEEIYFTDMIDFYIPNKNLAIIAMIFVPKNMIIDKTNRLKNELKSYDINKVEIITLEDQHEDEFIIDNIRCEIVTFWNWALRK